MSLLTLIAALLVAGALVSFVLALAGVLIGLAFKLLPVVLLVLAVLFFIRGGSVTVELPERWRRK